VLALEPKVELVARFADSTEHEEGDTIQVGDRFWQIRKRETLRGGGAILRCAEVAPTPVIHGQPITEFQPLWTKLIRDWRPKESEEI
jgi:hypothetical protein